jgi:glutamate-1-semialdehyde 2,1-aminomutase
VWASLIRRFEMTPSFCLDKSLAHHDQASRVIAGGVNSNVRLSGGTTPLFFEKAQGAHLTDLDGNVYIDYALGMGPAILGHAPKVVTDAVAESLQRGQIYAGQSNAELELARRLHKYVPGAELVRIGMTGSEMVQAALRVARAATGRNRFVKFAGHYHGWFDNVLTNECAFSPATPLYESQALPLTMGQTRGSLTDTVVLPWNNLQALSAFLEKGASDVAAVIMELVMCNTGVIPPAPGYLEGVRGLCNEHGVVFITDEVVTGFRLGLSGAQGALGVTGDLGVFAKALGGGVPVAALTGRRSLMSLIGTGVVNHSGTYNSNVVSVSAAIATLDALANDRGSVYFRIAAIGQALIDGMRSLAKGVGSSLIVQGYPSVFNTSFGDHQAIGTLDDYHRCDQQRQQRFLHALLEHGVRPTARGTWFVSAAHTEAEVEATLRAVSGALNTSL